MVNGPKMEVWGWQNKTKSGLLLNEAKAVPWLLTIAVVVLDTLARRWLGQGKGRLFGGQVQERVLHKQTHHVWVLCHPRLRLQAHRYYLHTQSLGGLKIKTKHNVFRQPLVHHNPLHTLFSNNKPLFIPLIPHLPARYLLLSFIIILWA